MMMQKGIVILARTLLLKYFLASGNYTAMSNHQWHITSIQTLNFPQKHLKNHRFQSAF